MSILDSLYFIFFDDVGVVFAWCFFLLVGLTVILFLDPLIDKVGRFFPNLFDFERLGFFYFLEVLVLKYVAFVHLTQLSKPLFVFNILLVTSDVIFPKHFGPL